MLNLRVEAVVRVACERGECVAGACIDKEMCAADTDCVEGKFCDGTTCASDPCTDGTITCERGVCDRATMACVNSECTEDTEATACLDGFKC